MYKFSAGKKILFPARVALKNAKLLLQSKCYSPSFPYKAGLYHHLITISLCCMWHPGHGLRSKKCNSVLCVCVCAHVHDCPLPSLDCAVAHCLFKHNSLFLLLCKFQMGSSVKLVQTRNDIQCDMVYFYFQIASHRGVCPYQRFGMFNSLILSHSLLCPYQVSLQQWHLWEPNAGLQGGLFFLLGKQSGINRLMLFYAMILSPVGILAQL